MSKVSIVEPRREFVSRRRSVKPATIASPQSEAVAVARRKIGTTWYAVMSNGQMIRHRPQRPWRGKSERRQVIKARRAERSEA